MGSTSTHEVAVAYRIYPRVSKIPAVYPDDKLKLASLCLRSFRASLGSLRVKVFALLDGCPPEFERLFQACFEPQDLEIIRVNAIGNQATFAKQIDILLEQEAADLVYFAEDDYFYLPGRFPELIAFLKQSADAEFVTPYDHPDCYVLPIHRGDHEIRALGTRHWRTAASSCLTFLTRKRTLADTHKIFRTYARKNLDVALWMSLTKRAVFNPAIVWRSFRARPAMAGYIAASWFFCWSQILFGKRRKLWVPVPSIATHMEKAFLAPAVDWQTAFRQLEEESAAPRT